MSNRTVDDKMDRILHHMFSDPTKAGFPLTETERLIKERVERIFTMWIDNTTWSDTQIKNWVMKTFDRTDREARGDVHMTKFLLGSVKNASRAFHQYRLNEMVLKVYRKAEENNDLANMNAAARTYAQFNRLDKEEAEETAFDKIIPPDWDFTTDVSVLGLKPIPNVEEVKQRIRAKYYGKTPEQISYEDIQDTES